MRQEIGSRRAYPDDVFETPTLSCSSVGVSSHKPIWGDDVAKIVLQHSRRVSLRR